jgi:hypothetical protein
MKEFIRKVLKTNNDLQYRIYEKKPKRDVTRRKLFIEAINTLKEIEDRTDFMQSELGVDMSLYEDKFFIVIENLFRITFSEEQCKLIEMYLYFLSEDKDWDGTIEIKTQETVEIVGFKTPEQVWEVLERDRKSVV